MSEKRKRAESPEEEEIVTRPIKPIPASKLQAFTIGSQKKSAFQKHKEEADLKKQQESIEAAKVYADFVASFEEPKSYQLGTTTFVKSGTLQPNHSTIDDHNTSEKKISSFKSMPFVRAGESLKPNINTTAKPLSLETDLEEDEDDALAKMKSFQKTQKKRNMDSFLEEIKKGQQVRNTRVDNNNQAGFTNASDISDIGSHDDGNPNTTNLYIGNINPTMTETGLCQHFGQFGPIASVKIMWPRTQEEKDKGNNCGFVSFMKRDDAAEAIRHLDGKDIEGFSMRVGWGKAVPLPAQPCFVLASKNTSNLTKRTGLPFNAQISVPGASGVNSARPRAEVRVVKPVDVKLMRVIHRVIERVLVHGPLFEAIIMEREQQNPMFKFLYDNNSPEHIYYRWKLYSLAQGDTKSKWTDEPFQMFEGGPWWIPPELPLIVEDIADPTFDTDDELAEQDNVSKGALGQIAKQRLSILLREVTFQRGTIARTMAFAIDHADAATEIVDLLCKSILVPDSPLSVKLARLYLISDILHNSSVHVSNAWKYRKEFESRLPIVFDHFNSIYRSINARLKAEQVRKHISIVINVWENWMIFPKYYTDQLTEIFLKKENGKQSPTSHNNENTLNEKFDGETLSNNGDIDSEPMDNVDGEPIEDVDGEPIEDVDGEPIEDVDGEPIEENFDSEPMGENEEDFTDVKDMFS